MKVQHFSQDEIVVNGERFTCDVVITNETFYSWRHEDPYRLTDGDVQEILRHEPECVIVGTGVEGTFTVPAELKAELEDKIDEVRVLQTEEALDFLDERIDERKRTIALIHVGC